MLWGEYNYDEDIAAQRQEAFDDGITRGRTEGSQQKAIETAKALLNFGDCVEKVSVATGLPAETIEQLAKETEAGKMPVH